MTTQSGKRTSSVTIALVALVLALGASTAYLATGANRSAPGTSGGGTVVTSPPAAEAAGQVLNGPLLSTTGGGAPDGITVTGTGDVSFTPTVALVGLSVVSQDSTAGAATSANAAATTAVIHALNSMGIGNGSIRTTSYDLSPQYNYVQGQAPTIMGYTVTNGLQVNVTASNPSDLGVRAGQVIDASVGAGANQVNLQFTAPGATLKQLGNQALQQAVADASNSAHTIASALGVSISGVVSATTSSSYAPQEMAFNTVTASTPSSIPTPLVPGTMTVSASVQVTYGIA